MPHYEPVIIRPGYELAESHVDRFSRLLADSAVFTFRNDATGAELTISYFPPFKTFRRSLAAALRNGQGQWLTLDGYLKAHQREDLIEKLQSSAPESVQDFWSRGMATLSQVSNKDSNFRDILDGKTWEDIPMDFGRFK